MLARLWHRKRRSRAAVTSKAWDVSWDGDDFRANLNVFIAGAESGRTPFLSILRTCLRGRYEYLHDQLILQIMEMYVSKKDVELYR